MKKIFKALAITAATAAMGTGIALASGCAGGNGTYTGEYHYSSWGQYYGMVVEVTVENNIITGVKDVTNTDNAYAKKVQVDKDGKAVEWHTVSPGWEDYSKGTENEGQDVPSWYNWSNADAEKWTNYENWLLQQYVGWSVADVLAIEVYYQGNGVPYEINGKYGSYNVNLDQSGLYISSATQGSGRLILAVQNALSK